MLAEARAAGLEPNERTDKVLQRTEDDLNRMRAVHLKRSLHNEQTEEACRLFDALLLHGRANRGHLAVMSKALDSESVSKGNAELLRGALLRAEVEGLRPPARKK